LHQIVLNGPPTDTRDSPSSAHPRLLDVMTAFEIELVASTLERDYWQRFKYRNAWRRLLLFRAALDLRAQGFGTGSIARKLSEQYTTEVRASTVTNWFRRYHPLGRNVVPVVDSNLGYVLGAAIGDGSANFAEAELRFHNLRDPDFAQEIKASVTCCSWIYKHPNAEIFDVEIANKLLTELVGVAKKHPSVLTTILSVDIKITRAAVRGFDAEGSGGQFLGAAVTKKEMIDLICTLLDSLDLHYTRRSYEQEVDMISPSNQRAYKRNSRLIHEVTIRRCCFLKFSTNVGFSIRRKQMKLQRFISQNKFRCTCS
jgi:hypothetical protein